jgi:hypothetical protein
MKLQIKPFSPEGLAPLGKKKFISNNQFNLVIIMKEKWYLFS